MAKIYAGRFTTGTTEPLAAHKWLPAALAMGPMLRSLYQDPESGFLGGEPIFYPGGFGLTQYKRSAEDLERFNKAIGKDGGVGIWRETYEVAAGRYETIYETIYGNMPRFGLAAATAHAPVGKRGETARERLASG